VAGSRPPIADFATTPVPLKVPNNGKIKDVNVMVRLNHENTFDLGLHVLGPSGRYNAPWGNGTTGGTSYGTGPNNCSGTPTVIDDQADTSIDDGITPYAGSFSGHRPLGLAFNGRSMKGTWWLVVNDDNMLDEGTIGCWKLRIRYKP
jgi:subtilisin-like proprotein convertase family protein